MAVADPVTRYAKAGDVHIAYQVVGRGPALVIVPGFVSHLELQWEDAAFRSFVRRLAQFSTVVRLDKRGTGLSDPVRHPPTLEERQADLAAVIDAVGVDRPVLIGISEGGPIVLQFAASRGRELSGLLLYGTFAKALSRAHVDKLRASVDAWGTGQTLKLFFPSVADDPVAQASRGRFERESASPAMARALVESMSRIDVSDLLPRITVPTLVLHRRGDQKHLVEDGRYLAAHIASARMVELEGIDHPPWLGDSQAVVDEIEGFVRSICPGKEPGSRSTSDLAAAPPKRPASGWASLTQRELAVVALVAEGCSNPVIAQRLYISRHTVESHVKHILARMGVDSRTALASIAGSHFPAPLNP